MFTLDTSDSYWFPVTVEMADADGKPRKHTFEARFRRFEQAELDGMMERLKAGELSDDDMARRVLIGWRDVRDQDGTELAYNEDNRERLLNVYPVRPSVVLAFFESLKAGKRKN